MRKMRSSGNDLWRVALSSRADARSRPKGFSTTTRPRLVRPTVSRDSMTSGNADGGMAK